MSHQRLFHSSTENSKKPLNDIITTRHCQSKKQDFVSISKQKVVKTNQKAFERCR